MDRPVTRELYDQGLASTQAIAAGLPGARIPKAFAVEQNASASNTGRLRSPTENFRHDISVGT